MKKSKKSKKTKSPVQAIQEPVRTQPSSHLPRIATLYQAIQRDRVGLERSLAMKPDVHDPEAKGMYETVVELEKRAVAYLNRECALASIYPWLSRVKGIGPRLSGMLVGLIDITRCHTVSGLWRYAGLAVIDGVAERPKKGEKLHYNHLLKKTCFLIARSFIMGEHQPYEGIYRNARVFYAANRPDWNGKRQDYAARRKMVKIFLSHLHTKWREAEGLPVRPPYAHGPLGHDQSGYIPPPENLPPGQN